MNPTAVAEVLERNGWSNLLQIEPLGVTGNNHVLRAEIDGRAVLVKEYFQHPADPRDRFNTERAFYTFLWEAGVRATPEPIAWLTQERLGVLEFIDGEKPQQATAELVTAAVDFFVELNHHRTDAAARDLPAASEACFSIEEHLACIGRRVARLEAIEPTDEAHESAREFVNQRLTRAWEELRQHVDRQSGATEEVLAPQARCLSPSDFGFHNAISGHDGRVRFFDFEYAGWDDPAKTVCDFFCQPAVPVPLDFLDRFLSVAHAEFPAADLQHRVPMLLPVYQTKWCCIMLNDFLPTGNRRRAFSNPEADEGQRRKRQLDKAIAFHRAVFP